MGFTATEYKLLNLADGHIFDDEGWSLSDKDSRETSLVRAVYSVSEFTPDTEADGLFRYHNWMPVSRCLKDSCAPVSYKSKYLAEHFGLSNLYMTFSGWHPGIGARFKTCSFKETEAYSVCARWKGYEDKILVVASAGNTARAFAYVCSANKIPLVVVIPEDNMDAMWFDGPLASCVKIIASPSGSDYFDAIELADKLCQSDRYVAEGGAKNIARRDGMGTILLSAIEAVGEIPDAYFQAVGSGTGAIAVWENNLRLLADGRFGNKKMRLMLSQNAPFTPLYDSWKRGQRPMLELTAEQSRIQAAAIKAKVLSNRKPPYSIAGGLFDALSDSNGLMYKVDNAELDRFSKIFAEKEGFEINPASAVAVASLAQAVCCGDVSNDVIILLNITGGGEKTAAKSFGSELFQARPDYIAPASITPEELITEADMLFGRYNR